MNVLMVAAITVGLIAAAVCVEYIHRIHSLLGVCVDAIYDASDSWEQRHFTDGHNTIWHALDVLKAAHEYPRSRGKRGEL